MLVFISLLSYICNTVQRLTTKIKTMDELLSQLTSMRELFARHRTKSPIKRIADAAGVSYEYVRLVLTHKKSVDSLLGSRVFSEAVPIFNELKELEEKSTQLLNEARQAIKS